jgi:hypothetical protein
MRFLGGFNNIAFPRDLTSRLGFATDYVSKFSSFPARLGVKFPPDSFFHTLFFKPRVCLITPGCMLTYFPFCRCQPYF